MPAQSRAEMRSETAAGAVPRMGRASLDLVIL